MVDISLSYLVVGLHQHNSVVEVFKADLDRQLNVGELPSMAAHSFFGW